MQHRVRVADLRLGMFVVAMDCSWLNSPFWRHRFLIRIQADIAGIRDAGIDMVTIDDARGIGIVAPPAPAGQADDEDDAPVAEPRLLVERRATPRPRRRISELDRARDIVERSKAAVTRMFHDARLGHAVQIADVAPLVDEIAASIERDRSAILNVTRLKTKTEYTYLHSVAVCALMMALARQIGLAEPEVRQAGLAGLLHDIGKMTTPQAVLDKPGGLDPTERRIIEDHPRAGHALLRDSSGVSDVALDVCLHHHERVDGTGYPFGLTGEELSLQARMGAICDVYDAVTSERPYKRAWFPAEALAKMAGWQGHFDELLLRAFIVAIGIFPVDSLVRLHSNRLGIVMDTDPAEPTTPRVRVFFQAMTGAFIAREDVATHNAPGGDPIIRGERGEVWFGDDWSALLEKVKSGSTDADLLDHQPTGLVADEAHGHRSVA